MKEETQLMDEMTNFVHTLFSEASNMVQDYTLDESDFQLKESNFYLPSIAHQLHRLTMEFPCWTAVMTSYFGHTDHVASSARSETHFADIK